MKQELSRVVPREVTRWLRRGRKGCLVLIDNSLQHVLFSLVVRESEEAEALCIMILLRVNTEIGVLVRNLIYG